MTAAPSLPALRVSWFYPERIRQRVTVLSGHEEPCPWGKALLGSLDEFVSPQQEGKTLQEEP